MMMTTGRLAPVPVASGSASLPLHRFLHRRRGVADHSPGALVVASLRFLEVYFSSSSLPVLGSNE